MGKERLSSPYPTLTLYYFAYVSCLMVSRSSNSPYSAIAGDILQDVYGSCDVRSGLAVHNKGTRIIPINLISSPAFPVSVPLLRDRVLPVASVSHIHPLHAHRLPCHYQEEETSFDEG